jgi:hypothetical protein
MRASPRFLFLAFLALSPDPHLLAAQAPAPTVAAAQNHRGWTDAIVLRNAVVEVVVVPSVGRVMQFRFVGETDGPFWENDKLAGQPMPPEPWKVAHGSFGGDKTWPAPQSAWNWPPPVAFDAALFTAHDGPDHSITFTSPTDARSGLRAIRRITLDPTEPVMRIATTYEKISGEPVPVAAWVIAQLRDPVAIFVPVPPHSVFPAGYAPTWKQPAGTLRREGDWLRLTRSPTVSQKTGNDGTDLIWAGDRQLLRLSIPRVTGATYTHGGCSVEVYTNSDPVPYVELETLGPVQTLRVGERTSATTTYRLAHRSSAPLGDDVRALLAR